MLACEDAVRLQRYVKTLELIDRRLASILRLNEHVDKLTTSPADGKASHARPAPSMLTGDRSGAPIL